MANGDFIKGFAIGVGVTIVIPVVAVALITGGRPLARALSRGTDMLSEKAREAVAETGEIIEDLIAESRADVAGVGSGPADAGDEPGTTENATRESSDAARGQG